MEPTIDFFGYVLPAGFAAAVMSAGSAVTASVITLVASTLIAGRRFRAQLKHDRTQKNEDRKAAIRREVYLKAIADTQAVLAEIGSLLERDLASDPATKLLNEYLTSMAKVSLVADPPAALLAQEVMAQTSEHFFAVLPAAFEYHHARADIPRLRTHISAWQEEQRRIGIEIGRAWERGESGEAVDRLFKSDDRFTSLIQLAQENIKRIESETQVIKRKFASLMFESGEESRETFMRLMSAARKELHLKPLEAQFIELLTAHRLRAEKLMRDFGLR